jgi:4-amino-4-deoxy-L-arabinose transferase-like glycosyltransferase
MTQRRALMTRLAVCFLVPMLVAALVAVVWVPLARQQAEEYLELALAPIGESSLLRPPGYVAFLRLVGAFTGGLDLLNFRAIYLAQAVLPGLGAVAVFLVARRFLEESAACLLALAFGCHPLVVVLVGYVHYDGLHISLLALSSLCVVNAFGGERPALRWALVAGVVVGLATLTRPVTLLFPATLALALRWLSGTPRERWLGWATFTAAMALTLAPRTINNFYRTGRFIPVNAQAGAAFWPMTESALNPDSDNFPWVPLWQQRGAAALAPRLGSAASNPEIFQQQPGSVDEALLSLAAERFRAEPRVYFQNVAHNLVFFWTGDSRRVIREFLFCQFAEKSPPANAPAVRYFIYLSAALHLLAAAGLLRGWSRRNPVILLAGSLFLALWVMHALVYLDARYLYASLPFLFWFAAYGLREMLPLRFRQRDLFVAGILCGASILGLGLLLA